MVVNISSKLRIFDVLTVEESGRLVGESWEGFRGETEGGE